MPTVFRLTEECDLEYSNDNGENWTSVPGWVDFAALCFTGPQGPPGETGPQGPAGPPGEDGECPDCGNPGTRPSPEPTITDDLESLCGGAMGSVQYLIDVLNYHLDQIEAHIGTFDFLLDLLTLNMKEALGVVPVVGLLIQVIDFVTTVGITQLRANVNNPDFKEITACQLYCIVKRDGGLTQSGYYEWWDLLALDSIFGALTDAGEYLKGVLTAMSGTNNFDPAFDRGYAAFSRRFAIAATNEDGSCELLCDDCPDEECDQLIIDWDMFGETPAEWTPLNGSLDTTGWAGDASDLAQSNYVTSRAGANTNWVRSGTAATLLPMGIRYTLAEPCAVTQLAVTTTRNSVNTNRVAIVVRRESDGVYEVLLNLVATAPTASPGTRQWTGDAITVTEVIFIHMSSINSGTPQHAITEVQINN